VIQSLGCLVFNTKLVLEHAYDVSLDYACINIHVASHEVYWFYCRLESFITIYLNHLSPVTTNNMSLVSLKRIIRFLFRSKNLYRMNNIIIKMS